MTTLNSTFALFADEPTKECIDCGSTDQLTVLCTTEDGAMWICPRCRVANECRARERAAAAANDLESWIAFDEWEEG